MLLMRYSHPEKKLERAVPHVVQRVPTAAKTFPYFIKTEASKAKLLQTSGTTKALPRVCVIQELA